MITIDEKKTKKVPGLTSLFITFTYKPEIVTAIKSLDCAIYDKKTSIWETPVSNLAQAVDMLSEYDDIQLNLLPEIKKVDKKYKIGPFKTKPFDYQLDAIQYGLNHDNWLLLDQPGLGKTLVLTYLAQELKKQGLKHCLVICGVNTLKSNWKAEIQKHSELSVRILGEYRKKNGQLAIGSVAERVKQLKTGISEFFTVTNIETLRSDDIIKELNNPKSKTKFDMIIVDEIHCAKSPTSQQGKNLLKLKSKYRVGATGTLLLNNPVDTYVPLKWIGVDNSTYSNFKYYYCNYGGLFGNELLGYKNTQYLKKQLETCSLRRMKDLLHLPPKTIIEEYVDMNDSQRLFYENIKNGIISQVDKVHMSANSVLGMVTRFRQATACPGMLTSENIESAKINRAVDLAEQLLSSGEKVVIFSVFKETLNSLATELANYKPLVCSGDIDDQIIRNNIENFQIDPNVKILLATTAKMGTGVTLTAASYAIFIDTPWTWAVYEQCQDRIYRIGSEKPVFIYELITKDTFDEEVHSIVHSKKAISDFIVDDKVDSTTLDVLKKYILELAGAENSIFETS